MLDISHFVSSVKCLYKCYTEYSRIFLGFCLSLFLSTSLFPENILVTVLSSQKRFSLESAFKILELYFFLFSPVCFCSSIFSSFSFFSLLSWGQSCNYFYQFGFLKFSISLYILSSVFFQLLVIIFALNLLTLSPVKAFCLHTSYLQKMFFESFSSGSNWHKNLQ